MPTIKELFDKVETNSASMVTAIEANQAAIIEANRNAYNCLQARLEELATSLGCVEEADVVFVFDRTNLNTSGEYDITEEWLIRAITELNVTPNGTNAAVISYPSDGTDGTTLNNFNVNHNLTASNVGLQVAIDGISQEVSPGSDGRRPIDQAINQANAELQSSVRTDSRKIIVVFQTGASNFANSYGTVATDPSLAADNARAAGLELYVVSVGPSVNTAEANNVAGGSDRVFHVDTFDELIYTVDSLKTAICSATGTFVDCIPEDPTMSEIPTIDVCETSGDCCDELF